MLGWLFLRYVNLFYLLPLLIYCSVAGSYVYIRFCTLVIPVLNPCCQLALKSCNSSAGRWYLKYCNNKREEEPGDGREK